MRKTLEQLYYGNISPCEQQYARHTDYSKAMSTVSEKEEQLKLIINEKEKTLLKDMISAQITVNSITAEENFIMGFRLGVRIGIEVMNDGDSCIESI